MDIFVSTSAVLDTAIQIDTINKNISQDLIYVDSAIKTLQKNWEGTASKRCVNRYSCLKNNFSETRFSVVDAMVSFLKTQVVQGYEETEHVASNAAEAFK